LVIFSSSLYGQKIIKIEFPNPPINPDRGFNMEGTFKFIEDSIEDYYGKKYFPATGIKYKSDLTLYRPSGCEVCSGTGYRGRLGIHELMEGTPKIKKMIKKQASTEEIFKQAMEEGMTTLNQDGTLKVLQGITDLTEVRRVCIT